MLLCQPTQRHHDHSPNEESSLLPHQFASDTTASLRDPETDTADCGCIPDPQIVASLALALALALCLVCGLFLCLHFLCSLAM